MLKAETIQKIDLGPRQLSLFDPEDRNRANQEQVMAKLTAWAQAKAAEVNVIDFTQRTAEALTLSERTVLQELFWLAHDLSIQFTSAGKALSPDQAFTILSQSPAEPVTMVLDPKIEAMVLQRVQTLFEEIAGARADAGPRDAVALARCLAHNFRLWKHCLEKWRPLARLPGFPGDEEIDHGLTFIRTISTKLDALSLINACYENAATIRRQAAEIKTLARFYDKHARMWQRLVRFAQMATETLAATELTAEETATYDRFRRILATPRPYNRVREACRDFEILKPIHDRILARQTEACRQAGLHRVEALIQRMQSRLDRHRASDHVRNRCLYALRQRLRAIEAASSMDQIGGQVRAAEEAFELLQDEVAAP
jgi:hypothetical protein